MAETATRLEKLVLNEISGVDDPANAAPGFAIFKSAATNVARELDGEVRKLVDEATSTSAEDIAKGFDAALAPVIEVCKALLTRIETLEHNATVAARKSLDGQEHAPVIPTDVQPTLDDTFASVLKGNKVTLT